MPTQVSCRDVLETSRAHGTSTKNDLTYSRVEQLIGGTHSVLSDATLCYKLQTICCHGTLSNSIIFCIISMVIPSNLIMHLR